ncbi:MAG: hotdog domain-containing protein [Thermodesulfobacteriota bacterium]
MEIVTHNQINRRLCGTPDHVEQGFARIKMQTTDDMAVDDSGLVHGGFIFGLADHAAMIAVNHPNVVLAGAAVKFIKPVTAHTPLVAEATVTETEGKKKTVSAAVYEENRQVFSGRFDCYVPEQHVLKG